MQTCETTLNKTNTKMPSASDFKYRVILIQPEWEVKYMGEDTIKTRPNQRDNLVHIQ